MKYTLITAKGSIMRFYVEECAKLYRNIYGGVLFCDKILVSGEVVQEEVAA